MKGVIYYTDNLLDDLIFSTVQHFISLSGLPITSASLSPIAFGNNEVVEGKRGYPTMVKQIVSCLKRSKSDYVFFCEHDVLYHKSHFDFTPPSDDLFYYNTNNWRWAYPTDLAIKYDGLSSLSQMCCNRKLALDHYSKRLEAINNLDPKSLIGNEPSVFRAWGYEPGTKKPKNGGFSEVAFGTWESPYPNIDIRHKGTFSPAKTTLDSFKRQPTGWIETNVYNINGWNLKDIWI